MIVKWNVSNAGRVSLRTNTINVSPSTILSMSKELSRKNMMIQLILYESSWLRMC
jgi:hypothetical protein